MLIQIQNNFYEIKECHSYRSRLMGMMFQKKPFNYGLYFPNCRSLHTFFMRQAIDIILSDARNHIVGIYYNVKPWHIVRNQLATHSYEFSRGILKNIEIGDTITLIKKHSNEVNLK